LNKNDSYVDLPVWTISPGVWPMKRLSDLVKCA
jgi:hypothetical protein